MNIGFFTATYYPTPDGVSHYLRDLKAALEKKGHSVHVFSLNGDRKEANVHVPYSVPFPAYPQYSVPIFPIPFHIFSLAKKAGLDIIHIHDPFMGSLGYRVSRQMGIPAVATFHTDFVRMKDSLNIPMKGLLFDMTWRYTIFLYRRCSTVLAPSRKTVRFLIDSGLTRVTELPLFVDDDVYRCEKRIVGDAFRVQFIGRITRDKGVFNILRIASLLKNNKDIKFVISGTGPDEERLVKNIRDQGLTETVEFTGYVSPEGKIDLLKRASVFLYPAVADTFGISVIEALSMGVPAIVGRDFPLMDYLNGTNFGLIGMNFDDPAAVAGFLQELSTDSSVLANHSMEAVRIVKHNFSKEEHCNRLLDIYSKLVDSGDQRS